MRILYITNNSYLRSTTSSLDAIISQLMPRGLEPVMLFREEGQWQRELAARGVPCYYDSLAIPDKYSPVTSARRLWRLKRLVRRERIELIHCNEHDHYPLMRYVARWTGVPAVATLHFKLERSFGHWAFRPPYLPAALNFISQAQLDFSRPALPPELDENRVKLIMSGMDIAGFVARGTGSAAMRASWKLADGDVVIGTASSLRAHKHLDEFVRLIADLRKRGLPVVGLIAGGAPFVDPGYDVTLQRLIDAEGLSAHCRLLGNLSPLSTFLQAIDIFATTSEWETFGMSLCEAMACGRPVLAYDVGGNPEAVPDPWCVTAYPNRAALADKAERLVVDRVFREEMGQKCEVFVRAHFDAPSLAERQREVYEDVLQRASRAVVR